MSRSLTFLAALTGFLGLTSCVGTIGDGATGPGRGNQPGDPGPGPSVKPPPPPVTTPGVEAVECRDFSTGPVFHRLNRTEWENSVNALLGTRQALRDQVGDDDILVDGFDNSADVGIDQTLMLKHLGAAQKAVDTALADPAAAAALVPCSLETANADCVKRTVEAFLPRAFRRPVQAAEVTEYAAYADICKSSPRAGLSCALQAVLVSPKFMYRSEFLGPEATDQACGVSDPLISATRNDLSPHAFAARLAYFITSSGPDAQLLDLAAKGRLNDPAVIAQQVDRLLSPEQSGRHLRPFIESLPTQWLQVDRVKNAAPSATLFPGWDMALAEAMQAESKLYFAELVRENRSALELIRSNFTFVNERLARHYGLTGVTGTQMRRVDTTGTPRGGILTQASFLTAMSSPENTSIVHRAKWVLTNLLCEHVTDPPGRRRHHDAARGRGRHDQPREPGAADQEPALQQLPRGHEPDRLRAGGVRPDRRAPHHPERQAHRPQRRPSGRRPLQRRRPVDGPAEGRRARARLPDPQAAHLRPRPQPGGEV
jgi:hypothetical protein